MELIDFLKKSYVIEKWINYVEYGTD